MLCSCALKCLLNFAATIIFLPPPLPFLFSSTSLFLSFSFGEVVRFSSYLLQQQQIGDRELTVALVWEYSGDRCKCAKRQLWIVELFRIRQTIRLIIVIIPPSPDNVTFRASNDRIEQFKSSRSITKVFSL